MKKKISTKVPSSYSLRTPQQVEQTTPPRQKTTANTEISTKAPSSYSLRTPQKVEQTTSPTQKGEQTSPTQRSEQTTLPRQKQTANTEISTKVPSSCSLRSPQQGEQTTPSKHKGEQMSYTEVSTPTAEDDMKSSLRRSSRGTKSNIVEPYAMSYMDIDDDPNDFYDDSQMDFSLNDQDFDDPNFELYNEQYEKIGKPEKNQNFHYEDNVAAHFVSGSCFQQRNAKPVYVYDCTYCNKKFRNRAPLNLHILSEHKDAVSSVAMCNDCGKRLEFEHELELHKLFVCKKLRRKYSCAICKLKFPTDHERETHPCTESNIKPYFCSQENCQFKSKTVKDLTEHVTRHLRIKPFLCTTCGSAFSTKKDLDRHTDTHIQTRDYACEDCERSFTSQHTLSKHILKHKFKDRFKCEHCPYTTWLRNSFNSHMLKHVQKAHKCTLCDKSLRSARSLAKHVKNRHTFNRIFTCRFCDFTTNIGLSFSSHMRKHKNLKECHSQSSDDEIAIRLDVSDQESVLQQTASLNDEMSSLHTSTPRKKSRAPMLADAASLADSDEVDISGQNADAIMTRIVSSSQNGDISILPSDNTVAGFSLYNTDTSPADCISSCASTLPMPNLIIADAISSITESWCNNDQS